MIKISAISYNNAALSAELSAIFDSEARTIGRSTENYFVLEDPKNLVSRSQASVKSDGDTHTITNLSLANPILLNGNEIAVNVETHLHVGDTLMIGPYLLKTLSAQNAANSADAVAQSTPNHAPSADSTSTSMHAAESKAKPGDANDHAALISAFLKGAGLDSLKQTPELTPEFMEMLGELLATSVQGTMKLNTLRSLVKREAKADVTMVVVRNNNPIKFLPDCETVLKQMLRKKMPGFMGPTEALNDAYHDLHGHQLGFVAGVRAAMGDLLTRLNPEYVSHLQQPSGLEKLLPWQRKAALWDSYAKQFEVLAIESQDDFRSVFGPVFLKAYEQEVARFNNDAHDAT